LVSIEKRVFSLNENYRFYEKRLVKGEKKIFGVCSGLANYFDMDPTIVRIIFLAALVFSGRVYCYI
jgi:phage shock protein PspC (stress-responsive transcriptional regulator)